MLQPTIARPEIWYVFRQQTLFNPFCCQPPLKHLDWCRESLECRERETNKTPTCIANNHTPITEKHLKCSSFSSWPVCCKLLCQLVHKGLTFLKASKHQQLQTNVKILTQMMFCTVAVSTTMLLLTKTGKLHTLENSQSLYPVTEVPAPRAHPPSMAPFLFTVSLLQLLIFLLIVVAATSGPLHALPLLYFLPCPLLPWLFESHIL